MKRAYIALSAILLGACAHHYRIVGYVTPRADISRISARELTHINYAFGKVSESGDVILNADAPAKLAQLQALKAENPHLKVILSIGGWGADNFSDAAFNRATRDRFTRSAMTILEEYALDGIDLDWEYPGQPGPGIKYREEDKEDFTLLLKDLRQQLDALSDARGRHGADRYSLSIATAGGPYFQHTEMEKLHKYVDWINIMGYDFAGEWSKTTEHHAPMSGAESFVRQHLAAGIPSRKLVLGVPFYGRAWCGTSGLHEPVEAYAASIPFAVIERQYIGHGFERHWDRAEHAPYLWSSSEGIFVTYEDVQSLRYKADFVKRNHLGGMMFWEMSDDPDQVLLSVMFNALR
ncbi:MAG TPA: glycoside hydrolase family 18 protein [Thermoanaerobaculia bacterium]|nr:glycoside hydrolase family 18 protein [Thermoanaerobaculia bacterium]